ncbi:MAG: hypothetical protein M9958_04675 [Chitinophagales bacterium]|nr:hypothetical protein [Chitinophagales bacterium]
MIPHYIYDLLLENDYVVVPGLGGFVCQDQSATIDRQRKEIIPPSRTIAFNRMLQQNDGLLIQHIVMKEQLSHKYAEETVREFVAKCNEQLYQLGSVQFPKIGRLYMDELKSIQFSPASEPLPLDSSFGLTSFSIQPIRRIDEVVELGNEESVVDNVVKIKSQKRWPYWVAASFAGIFMLGSTWLNLGQPSMDNLMTAGVFTGKSINTSNPTHSIDLNNEQIQSEYLFTHQVMKKSLLSEEEVIYTQKDEVASSSSSNVYAIVVGAFKGPITAGKYKVQLEEKGYNVEVLEPSASNKLIKIVIHYPAESEEIALADIRTSVEENAWLLN